MVEYEPWAVMSVALLFLKQRLWTRKGFFGQQNDSWNKEMWGSGKDGTDRIAG